MVIRFFVLQSHYTSTLDFSTEALDAAEKGYKRLMSAWHTLSQFTAADFAGEGEQDEKINELIERIFTNLNDDFNTAQALAPVFELVSMIFALQNNQLSKSAVSADMLAKLQTTFNAVLGQIMGLKAEIEQESQSELAGKLVELLLEMRTEARQNKDFATSDKIRDRIQELNIKIKDGKDGTSWELP